MGLVFRGKAGWQEHHQKSRRSILTSCFDAGVHSVYKTRHDPAFREKLLWDIQRASREIRILGIAAREFLHEGLEGDWLAYSTIRSLSKEKNIEFLLLHPWCEQAVSRGLREDRRHSTFDRYLDTRLVYDVIHSCDTLVSWSQSGSKVEARLYKVMPSCFLVVAGDVMFIEHYQFGTGGRASGKVPVLEVHKGSRLYGQFEGHFEHIWKTAKPYKLTPELVTLLRDPPPDQRKSFEESMRFLRPDLL